MQVVSILLNNKCLHRLVSGLLTNLVDCHISTFHGTPNNCSSNISDHWLHITLTGIIMKLQKHIMSMYMPLENGAVRLDWHGCHSLRFIWNMITAEHSK